MKRSDLALQLHTLTLYEEKLKIYNCVLV